MGEGRDDRGRSVRVAIVGVGNCAASLVQACTTTGTPSPTLGFRV